MERSGARKGVPKLARQTLVNNPINAKFLNRTSICLTSLLLFWEFVRIFFFLLELLYILQPLHTESTVAMAISVQRQREVEGERGREWRRGEKYKSIQS